MQDPQNPTHNRGFAFVEYYNNACADYSKQKLSSADFKLEGNSPTVSWADPKSNHDHSAASQVNSRGNSDSLFLNLKTDYLFMAGAGLYVTSKLRAHLVVYITKVLKISLLSINEL